MHHSKISSFFLTDKEIDRINRRRELLQIVVDEVGSDPNLVEMSNGKVWGWFRMGSWKRVLLESGLSDEDRIHLMRLCVKEKVKYQNMGEKGLKNFISGKITDLKSKKRKTTPLKRGGADQVGVACDQLDMAVTWPCNFSPAGRIIWPLAGACNGRETQN